MEIPENYVQKLIILILGKHDKLSGKQVYKEAQKEGYCSKEIIPKYATTYYDDMKMMEKKGFIKQVEEKRVRGTLERFYALTEKGREALDEVQDIFVIDSENVSFVALQHRCSDCTEAQLQQCWKIYGKNLEIVLNDLKDVFPKSKSENPRLLKQIFKTPAHLREFIFWLRMLKLPRKRLEGKFADQMECLGLK